MNIDILLAHSSRRGNPAQTYFEHIANVRKQAVHYARNAANYYNGQRDKFIGWVEAAATYHDLGKLDYFNQAVLKTSSRKRLPIDHEDAGATALWKLKQKEAAVLVAAHHAGLFSKKAECPPNKRRLFRNEKYSPLIDGTIDEHVDAHLDDYLIAHYRAGLEHIGETDNGQLHRCGFTRRVALSCLIDADHGDTARHYSNEIEVSKVQRRWKERLVALQQYVNKLPKGNTMRERHRNSLRKRLFEACYNAPIEPSIRVCDAPVGSGKTTAIMAHLLRVAVERKPELRHIIIVIPYTNIITQSVEIYRKALVLEGERPEEVVVEHHHRADFEDINLRQLATHWKAPIIVTTAVQFFETLGSADPARLRKLHELPGSAVFVDEVHAAIPSHLWPQMWRWLETWCRNWGGHLVLASGSLPRFWELNEYSEIIRGDDQTPMPEVPDLIKDKILRNDLKQAEERRITYMRRPEKSNALDCDSLIDFVIHKKPGPRLLIVNTVQTAAFIAQAMRKSGHDVLHLSTALAPIHRSLIVERVKRKLHNGSPDWTLVSTSCVEAGMNFSFRIGFRERASTSSLIQIGGRVNRGDEFNDAEVWDLLIKDDCFSINPSLTISRQALDYFSISELNYMHPAQLATFAYRREWSFGAKEKARQLINYEEKMEYPSVAKECRVIDADTRIVIIDKALVESIQKGDRISKDELLNYSVQIWANKIEKLSLTPVIKGNQSSDTCLYYWPYEYDPNFLGYMEGVLRLEEFISAGGVII